MHSPHLDKAGIRGLGLAESHALDSTVSVLAGVVMSDAGVVDGFTLGSVRSFGDDATSSMIRLATSLHRDDLSYVLVWETLVSRYNLVNVDEISTSLGLPVLGLSGRMCRSAETTISTRFPARLGIYRALPARRAIRLNTGCVVCAQITGCTLSDVTSLLNTTIL